MEEIRRAYLRLARVHHPDYFVDASPAARADAEWRMRVLNEAWAVLGDDGRRRALDADRPLGFQPLSPDDDDEEDPRLAPDVPYRPDAGSTPRERLTVLAPVLLFASSVVVGVLGSFMRLTGVVALSFVLFVLSCIGFLVVPLLALGRARQDEG